MSLTSSSFEPIAIVGVSSIFPGAFTPESYVSQLRRGRDLLRVVPKGRWRLDEALAYQAQGEDGCWSDRGGFVEGFDAIFDAGELGLDEALVRQLDELFSWVLYTGQRAWAQAGFSAGAAPRAGVVLGNLSFPSESLVRWASHQWLEQLGQGYAEVEPGAAAHNRFMSGLPAKLLSKSLGLQGPSYAIDAACASSLYAIKLACLELQHRRADVMIAGAVQRADNLFLHMGFCALQAMSKSGQSRPFHRDADGLIPAEGAASVVLMRLEDALKAHKPILGIVRGVGLSNDGRGKGLLAPSSQGQQRAMLAALAQAGLAPSQIDYVECHATGTILGDKTELESLHAVYGGHALKIGSHKSNMGHAITAAGMAGLVKVLGSMEQGLHLPTLHLSDDADLVDGMPPDLEIVRQAEPWATSADAPRRAAVSAFGFGGNNAHLIVEEYIPGQLDHFAPWLEPASEPVAQAPRRLAIVDLEVRVGQGGLEELARAAFHDQPLSTRSVEQVELSLQGLRFPPNDMQRALPQQWWMMEVARVLASRHSLDAEQTAVLIGMECDTAIARFGARWRAKQWGAQWEATNPDAQPLDPEWLEGFRSCFEGVLEAQHVIGTMPNVPANRINSQLDAQSVGFTVSAHQDTTASALEVAANLLFDGQAKAALVGAVELGADALHERAAREVIDARYAGLDAAVAFLVVTAQEALARNLEVMAYITLDHAGVSGAPSFELPAHLGDAHSAQGALELAVATLAARHQRPLLGGSAVFSEGLAWRDHVISPAPDQAPARWPWSSSPALSALTATDRDALEHALMRGQRVGRAGLGQLTRQASAFAQNSFDEVEHRRRLMARLESPKQGLDQGVWLFDQPLTGKLGWLWTEGLETSPATLADQWRFMQERLGLTPDHVSTLNPGALLELTGHHAPGFMDELHCSELLTRDLGGTRDALRRYWFEHDERVLATLDDDEALWGAYLAPLSVMDAHQALEELRQVWLARVHHSEAVVLAGYSYAVMSLLADFEIESEATPWPLPFVSHCPATEYVSGLWGNLHRRELLQAPPWALWVGAQRVDPAQLGHAAARSLQACFDLRALVQGWLEEGVDKFIVAGAGAAQLVAAIEALLPDDAPRLVVASPADLSQELDVAQVMAGLWSCGEEVPFMPLVEQSVQAPVSLAPSALPGPKLYKPAHRPWPALTPPRFLDVVSHETKDHQSIDQAPISEPEAKPNVAPLRAPRPLKRLRPSSAPAPTPQQTASSSPAPTAISEVMRQTSDAAAAQRALLERQRQALTQSLAQSQREVLALADIFHEAEQEFNATSSGVHPQVVENLVGYSALPGPKLSRAQLEHLSFGKISAIFGPMFAPQDDHLIQTRMPKPPLLLCDRVLGIDAQPGSMSQGTIWTETDVTSEAWYLHQGRMPAGIMIEAGQADLLLASYLGVDLHQGGDRAYRLLGCELTYHGPLPQVGQTLRYEIQIDGFAQQGQIRLFFFHYDCTIDGQLYLSVRHGQAGFFTRAELDDSNGVLWEAEQEQPTPLTQPSAERGWRPVTTRRAFGREQLESIARGELESFGPAFSGQRASSEAPTIAGGKLLFLDQVTALEPEGGPWGRGYLRAQTQINASDWFFDGHFHNDPCMPGTLMFEASLQTMQLYMMAHGLTLEREGWRFEPVTELPYLMRCRGQIVPTSGQVVYELFVQELITEGATPTLYADLLVSVDGLKAFHCKRMGLKLTRPAEAR